MEEQTPSALHSDDWIRSDLDNDLADGWFEVCDQFRLGTASGAADLTSGKHSTAHS